MISTNKINLIVEQNKYFNYYENKKIFTKNKSSVKYRKIFQLLLNELFVLKKHCKMQNKFSNIYIMIKITYIYFKYTLLSNTEQLLK